jgi:hypothetical protein
MGRNNSQTNIDVTEGAKCAYCSSGAPATEHLYHVSMYQGWPIREIYQCTSCASWGLCNRPDIYSTAYEQAQVNQTTKLLTEG